MWMGGTVVDSSGGFIVDVWEGNGGFSFDVWVGNGGFSRLFTGGLAGRANVCSTESRNVSICVGLAGRAVC